ncbi:MAG: aspartate-semialdehyde dehydrogenase, partial [Actinomycetota bacterium]
MKVAVVGATGAVGREMTRILEERDFPVDKFLPLASARSAGRTVRFRGRDRTIVELSVDALRGTDIALVSAGATVSRAFIPEAAAGGTTCIDNSSAFRMDPDVPLVVPDVNGDALQAGPKIISVPNCTTITAVLPLGPLHHAAGLTGLILSSYQSVSGAGHRGVSELVEQIEKLQGHEDELTHPEPGMLPEGPVFGKTIAYNVIAKIGEFEPGG